MLLWYFLAGGWSGATDCLLCVSRSALRRCRSLLRLQTHGLRSPCPPHQSPLHLQSEVAVAKNQAVGSMLTVYGWGATNPGNTNVISNDLQSVDVPVYQQAPCLAAYGSDFVTASQLCAGYPQGGKDGKCERAVICMRVVWCLVRLAAGTMGRGTGCVCCIAGGVLLRCLGALPRFSGHCSPAGVFSACAFSPRVSPCLAPLLIRTRAMECCHQLNPCRISSSRAISVTLPYP